MRPALGPFKKEEFGGKGTFLKKNKGWDRADPIGNRIRSLTGKSLKKKKRGKQ